MRKSDPQITSDRPAAQLKMAVESGDDSRVSKSSVPATAVEQRSKGWTYKALDKAQIYHGEFPGLV